MTKVHVPDFDYVFEPDEVKRVERSRLFKLKFWDFNHLNHFLNKAFYHKGFPHFVSFFEEGDQRTIFLLSHLFDSIGGSKKAMIKKEIIWLPGELKNPYFIPEDRCPTMDFIFENPKDINRFERESARII